MSDLERKQFSIKAIFLLLFWLALAAIYVFGSLAALKTSYVWDTDTEQNTLEINIKAVNGLLHGDRKPYQALLDYQDKFYGIGFHAPAYPVQKLLDKPVARLLKVPEYDAFLRIKQWLTFNLFFASAILILWLSRRLVSDEGFSRLSALCYLLWPYLLGHSLLNVKDVPFLFGWLLCSCLSYLAMERYRQGQDIGRYFIGILAVCTGWLISVRIAGILIFLQYAITFFVARRLSTGQQGNVSMLKRFHLPLFFISLIVFVILAYPILWLNPLNVFWAIFYMSKHPMGIFGYTTLTFGVPMPAGNLPLIYIPAWLTVKLPIIVILGYLALPMTFARIGKDETSRLFFRVMFYTSVMVPVLLSLLGVVLYNELRQLLFLMPLYFLVGVISLYSLSHRLSMTLLAASICIFLIDNFMAFPYQYVWFNEIARQFKVERYFETDYESSSGKSLAKLLSAGHEMYPSACVYVNNDLLFRNLVERKSLTCIKTTTYETPPPRPFLFADYIQNESPGFPPDCVEIGREKFHLFMGNGDITLAKVVYCK